MEVRNLSRVFGISGTKRTVRNREVSVRRGLTVERSSYAFYNGKHEYFQNENSEQIKTA